MGDGGFLQKNSRVLVSVTCNKLFTSKGGCRSCVRDFKSFTGDLSGGVTVLQAVKHEENRANTHTCIRFCLIIKIALPNQNPSFL